MNRALQTLLVPLLVATAGWVSPAPAQAAPDPDPFHRPSPRPATAAAALPIEPLAAGSGITSELETGDLAPDFALRDEQGRWVRRADLKGVWTAIVFTGNLKRLGPLKGIEGPLRDLGVRLYGISADGTGALLRYRGQQDLSLELLSDPTRQVSQVYGMFDPNEGTIASGIVVLDPKGYVRSAELSASLEPELVLDLIRKVVPGPGITAILH
jgi:peroxiredoxin Q/BCP